MSLSGGKVRNHRRDSARATIASSHTLRLIVDPYAVLTRPFATQGLKSVTRRDTEIIQMGSGIELLKLEQRSPLQLLWHGRPGMFGRSPAEDIFRTTAASGTNNESLNGKLTSSDTTVFR